MPETADQVSLSMSVTISAEYAGRYTLHAKVPFAVWNRYHEETNAPYGLANEMLQVR